MTIDVQTAPPSPARHAREHGVARARVVRVTLAVGGFVALVALLDAASLHAVVGNSDGATVVLEGQAMSTGNALLHHWSLSLDSFWTIDALFYTVAVPLAGVTPALLSWVPAVIAAVVVVSAALTARSGHRGAPAVAAMVTVAALLALPGHVLADYFLQGPLHVGTALWCLLAFAALRRGRFGWGWAAAVVLFAGGVLGDFQTAVMGMLPALCAGVVAGLRTRRWRRAVPTATAPVAGAALALVVRAVTLAVGTFGVTSAHPTATGLRLVSNLGLVATWGARMLGVGGGGGGDGGVPSPLELVHVVGAAVVVAGVAVAAVRLAAGVLPGHAAPAGPPEAWHLEDLLLFGLVGDLVLFVTLTYSPDQDFSRYLTAAVIFGAVLGARLVARAVAAATPRRRWRMGVVGVVVVAAFGAGVGFTLRAPQPRRPVTQLVHFLEAHGLDHGVGDYWSASLTTVSSDGTVTVRPVIADPTGHIGRYDRQSDQTWYRDGSFEFLVYDTAMPWGGITPVSARHTFGPVAHTYRVGTYRVLVWAHLVVVHGTG